MENTIESVNIVQNLDVHVSHDLSFKNHCFEITKRTSEIANTLLHSFSCTDVNVYIRAFDTYVMSIIDYCSFVWTPIFTL